MTELLVTGLHHDLSKKRSFVHFVCINDPDKRLGVCRCPFNARWTICRAKQRRR
jgi:hypothetical protein